MSELGLDKACCHFGSCVYESSEYSIEQLVQQIVHACMHAMLQVY